MNRIKDILKEQGITKNNKKQKIRNGKQQRTGSGNREP